MRAETSGDREDRLAALADRTNAVRARLTLEADERANHEILMGLIGVVSHSSMYAAAADANRFTPGAHTSQELQQLQKAISEEFLKIERLCREHLGSLEAGKPAQQSQRP